MTSIPKSNELIFIRNYYSMLCNRPATIQQYYMDDSQLTISREQDRPEVCTRDFGKYIKSRITRMVSKVLISHVSYQKIDDLRSVISVVGQFVYSNASQERISHQFVVVRRDSVLHIKNEILTFLDEEVVYEAAGRKTVVVGYEKRKMSEAIEFISGFGDIVSIENKESHRLLMTLRSTDDVENIKKNAAKVIAQGYELEIDGLRI